MLKKVHIYYNRLLRIINGCVSEKGKPNQMTAKVILETTSTVTSLHVSQQKQASLTETLPRKPFLAEPQNDSF